MIEAEMYGGEWAERRGKWTLTWTLDRLRDFYLNNILIHELGHLLRRRRGEPFQRLHMGVDDALEVLWKIRATDPYIYLTRFGIDCAKRLSHKTICV